MADEDSRPLTDEERAELEALRAEKARRERAELEALRAEGAATAPASAPASAAAPGTTGAAPAAAAPQATPAVRPQAAPAPRRDEPAVSDDPAERTFGQRMVLSSEEDDDGIPTMPPAQKIVIGICLLLAIVAIVYVVLTNNGMIG